MIRENSVNRGKNFLQYETSPYLTQHAENPVNWYPWGDEAFKKAKAEDKPVFLSIGYSTCHWCHVMAHESFEDEEIAEILNRHFVSIKVDKEERPDVDSIYMSVCQAFTGNGGWPTSIFMTYEQKPFFAGTYFPKNSQNGMIGLQELLEYIIHKWEKERAVLLNQAESIIAHLKKTNNASTAANDRIIDDAVVLFQRTFDRVNGGFGAAPKFPTPHNLMFLLSYYQSYGKEACLNMADHTLLQMYRGGLFDHIGGGFCRYSTDERFLVPHFEKMLYDNALLIIAYCRAHAVIKDEAKTRLFLRIAERTAEYILREMTSDEGGFYSAQDADSEGEEGKYYVFTPDEIVKIIGEEEGGRFCRQFNISDRGNFEGKSIPNLLKSDPLDASYEEYFPKIYHYRKSRHALHLDKKILTSWNSLMIAAMCELYIESRNKTYLDIACKADEFIQNNLYEDGVLFASYTSGKKGVKGFLDDYAAYCFASMSLYEATFEEKYLDRAEKLCEKAVESFEDKKYGGFYFSGDDNEKLILRPKDTYDGAIPSGNSLMAWNFVKLWQLTGEEEYRLHAERQLEYLAAQAEAYPMGHSMFLLAFLKYKELSVKPEDGC